MYLPRFPFAELMKADEQLQAAGNVADGHAVSVDHLLVQDDSLAAVAKV